MDFQHVCALVEQRLAFGVGLGLSGENPRSSRDGAVLLVDGALGRFSDGVGGLADGCGVSIKNVATGLSVETQTDSAGLYTAQNLTAGDYEVSASLEGIGAGVANVTLAAGSQQTLNLTWSSAAPGQRLARQKRNPHPRRNDLEPAGEGG